MLRRNGIDVIIMLYMTVTVSLAIHMQPKNVAPFLKQGQRNNARQELQHLLQDVLQSSHQAAMPNSNLTLLLQVKRSSRLLMADRKALTCARFAGHKD